MEIMPYPEFIIIAGANGAGKTTIAANYLNNRNSIQFINADEIYKSLTLGDKDNSPLHIEAGKIAIKLINKKIIEKKSFILETTLSGKLHKSQIEKARTQGFKIKIIYIYLPNAQLAIQRVKQRVSKGGHNIPQETIKRRYKKSLINLILLKDIVDEIIIIDNTKDNLLTIYEKNGNNEVIHNSDIWQHITGE